jgi:general secretion pathway protein N
MSAPGPWRWAIYAALGAACYLLFLIATLPAAWLSWGIARLSEGDVILAGVEGSVWRGGATLLLPHLGPSALGRLEWSVQPLALLAGRLQYRLRLDGTDAQARATLIPGLRRLGVRGLEAAAPAGFVARVYAPASLFAPTGQVRLVCPELELGRNGMHGTAELTWENAGGRFTGAAPLGDYRLELVASGERASLTLRTLRGDLELSGAGEWRLEGTEGRLQFSGSAVPRARRGELEPLLATLGPDLGGGRRAFGFTAHAPLRWPLVAPRSTAIAPQQTAALGYKA